MVAGLGRREAVFGATAVKVVWTTPAIRDVEAHVAYLDQVNPLAARELAITLFAVADSLSVMPNRGRRGRIPGTRELLAASPYVIVYEVRSDIVTIHHIWHGKLLA